MKLYRVGAAAVELAAVLSIVNSVQVRQNRLMKIFGKTQPAGSVRDHRIVADICASLSSEQLESPQDIARDILRRHELKYSQ